MLDKSIIEPSGSGRKSHTAGQHGDSNGGVYVLLVYVPEAIDLSVGALAEFHFQPGSYLYTGSARRYLRQRVERHFKSRKPVRWHIDYLTTAAGAKPIGAVIFPGKALAECAMNQAVGRLCGNSAPIPGFGSSDCRSGCPAHLWYSPKPVEPSNFAKLIGGSAFCLGWEQTRRVTQGG